MKLNHSKSILAYLVVVPLLAFMAGCDSGPASLAAADRPIPAQLPPAEREAFRRLPLEGAHNFRDLGGYKTQDGRVTKWGLVYRSDELSGLTRADQQYLGRLDLKTVVDFRSDMERVKDPDQIGTATSAREITMPITVTGADVSGISDRIKSGELTEAESFQFMVDANREFVETYTPLYRQWIHTLLDPNTLPTVFHCTAGKDRTGFGAAILLRALGVDQATVMSDYLASNGYNEQAVERMFLLIRLSSFFQTDTSSLKPLFSVNPEYLETAFSTINRKYGSFENYLRSALQLTIDQQQQLIDLLTTTESRRS